MTIGLLDCPIFFVNHKLAALIVAYFPSVMNGIILMIEMFDGFLAAALF